jgi:hypothetical protein
MVSVAKIRLDRRKSTRSHAQPASPVSTITYGAQGKDRVLNARALSASAQPKIETKNGALFFNPGSAGPRRFRLPITVGRVTEEHGKLRAEIVELGVEC